MRILLCHYIYLHPSYVPLIATSITNTGLYALDNITGASAQGRRATKEIRGGRASTGAVQPQSARVEGPSAGHWGDLRAGKNQLRPPNHHAEGRPRQDQGSARRMPEEGGTVAELPVSLIY